MTGRERLEAIFEGELVDKVPFALKGWRIPQCEAERKLRNEGMCILDARPVYSVSSPNVSVETLHFTEGGVGLQRTTIHTPKGDLTTLSRRSGGAKTENTTWQLEWMFKGPKDYEAIEFMIRDRRYAPAYEPFLKAQEQIGNEAFFKTGAPGAPIHEIMYNIMGLDQFAVEWAERRDQVLALHQAMVENQRPIYQIVADSPARIVQCGGNYAPEVLGKERFVEFVLPHWEEICSVLHEKGKKVGCHLDADNALWAEEVGASPLDWIEAFSPFPDTDMTVADARRLWPGKVLFINFPSAVHLESAETIEKTTRQLLREAAPGDRFIVGITENVPDDRWRESFQVILDTLNECGRLPIQADRI